MRISAINERNLGRKTKGYINEVSMAPVCRYILTQSHFLNLFIFLFCRYGPIFLIP